MVSAQLLPPSRNSSCHHLFGPRTKATFLTPPEKPSNTCWHPDSQRHPAVPSVPLDNGVEIKEIRAPRLPNYLRVNVYGAKKAPVSRARGTRHHRTYSTTERQQESGLRGVINGVYTSTSSPGRSSWGGGGVNHGFCCRLRTGSSALRCSKWSLNNLSSSVLLMSRQRGKQAKQMDETFRERLSPSRSSM